MPLVGSLGDLLPLLNLGTVLTSRGHAVTVIAPPPYEGLITRTGLGFVALADACSYAHSASDKILLNTRYYGLFFRRHAVPWNLAIYKLLRDRKGTDMATVSPDRANLWADLFANAEMRIAAVRIHIDLPIIEGVTVSARRLPDSCVQTKLTEQWQSQWREGICRIGADVESRCVRQSVESASSSVPRLGSWPAWIGRAVYSGHPLAAYGFIPPPAHPGCRFVFSDPGWAGSHIVFIAGTDGTLNSWWDTFLEVSISLCNRLKAKGVILGERRVITISPRSGLRFTQNVFVSLSDALRGAALIVHHGGIGTAAAALRHGIPQLIVPRVFAQPSNAEWMRRLGVAAVVAPRNYRLLNLLSSVEFLLTDRSVHRRTIELSRRAETSADLNEVSSWVERVTGAEPPCRESHFA